MLSHLTVHTQWSFCFGELQEQTYGSHSDLKSIIVYIKPYGQWLSPCMIESVWGTGVTAPCFLKLSTRWGWVVRLSPQPLCSWWKSCQYPVNSRLGGCVSLDVLKKGGLLPLHGTEPLYLSCPACGLVTIPTVLSSNAMNSGLLQIKIQ
jgi:hypothetical protein